MKTSSQNVLEQTASPSSQESSSPPGNGVSLTPTRSEIEDSFLPEVTSGSSPSGNSPISSGRSATKNNEGATEMANTISPMTIQVVFNP